MRKCELLHGLGYLTSRLEPLKTWRIEEKQCYRWDSIRNWWKLTDWPKARVWIANLSIIEWWMMKKLRGTLSSAKCMRTLNTCSLTLTSPIVQINKILFNWTLWKSRSAVSTPRHRCVAQLLCLCCPPEREIQITAFIQSSSLFHFGSLIWLKCCIYYLNQSHWSPTEVIVSYGFWRILN